MALPSLGLSTRAGWWVLWGVVGVALASPCNQGLAQSTGGLSVSGTNTQMNDMESRALLQVGRQGGNLLPQDTLADCKDGAAQVGRTKEKEFIKVPTSLMDELKEKEATSTVVIGNVIAVGCK
ncbi:hypothetical protein [Magnetospirillum molischianum]|uniref:Uncharacterized protein n=1 Tax=Magnetospirillum molischianum DSM 120 TaxID=1150626 RepID=H8FS49_MAGML|nr:hypothetical protein [Magnetospirillum molischianum]CCG41187.1 exported hypothetical protein [Magnetospirillum molischianum DSM 120]